MYVVVYTILFVATAGTTIITLSGMGSMGVLLKCRYIYQIYLHLKCTHALRPNRFRATSSINGRGLHHTSRTYFPKKDI